MAATPEQSGPTEPGLQVNWRLALSPPRRRA